MLTLWEPFTPVKTMSNGKTSTKSLVDKLFSDPFQDWFVHPAFGERYASGIESKKNEDGTVSVSVDVPGIAEQDLSIEVQNGILSVRGERKTTTSSYSMHKSFSIPEDIDADNIVAELKNGVLNLTLIQKISPKSEVKKIPIKT